MARVSQQTNSLLLCLDKPEIRISVFIGAEIQGPKDCYWPFVAEKGGGFPLESLDDFEWNMQLLRHLTQLCFSD